MRTLVSLCLLAGILLQTTSALAQQGFGLDTGNRLPLVRSSVLPAEEAFALSTFIEAPDTVVLLWEIQEDYYLYRKSITANSTDDVVDMGELPEGTTITDEFFGEVNVYFDRVFIRFPLSSLAMDHNTASFTLHYQGCAKDKYCYPMQSRMVELSLPE